LKTRQQYINGEAVERRPPDQPNSEPSRPSSCIAPGCTAGARTIAALVVHRCASDNLLTAGLRPGTCQKEDEARAWQDFDEALRNPAAGRITWPDTLLPGETVALTDELTVFQVWLRLFNHKERWGTIGEAIRFELQQFKFR
jgi:hypothetical protein